MAIVSLPTNYGYVVTCTGGTAAATLITSTALDRVRYCGVSCSGSATSYIITVQDGEGHAIYTGYGALQPLDTQHLSAPVNVIGMKVGITGGTAGSCVVFMANH